MRRALRRLRRRSDEQHSAGATEPGSHTAQDDPHEDRGGTELPDERPHQKRRQDYSHQYDSEDVDDPSGA